MDTQDFNLEVYKSIVERSAQVVKYCFLINGGAIVALLAFLGQIWGERVDIDPSRINTVVLWFVFGLILAVVASIFDYLGLSYLLQEQKQRAKRGGNERYAWISFSFVILSVAGFVVGAVLSATILAEGATWDSAATWDSGPTWDSGAR